MESDDAIDVQPWPPVELVGQLVTHATLGRRGLIEGDADADMFNRETDRFELEAWARLELSSWLTDEATAILSSPSGNLDSVQVDRCADALLVASAIAWAIRVPGVETLPLPTNGDVEGVLLAWAPGPWTPVRNVYGQVRTRDDEALGRERERWELIAWRCSLFQDEDMIEDDRVALRETIDELAGGILVANDGNDFTLDDGRSFHELAAEVTDQLAHEAEVRLQTLNWTCGFGATPHTAPLFLDD